MSNIDTEDNDLGFYEEPAIKRAKYEPISIDIDEEFDNFVRSWPSRTKVASVPNDMNKSGNGSKAGEQHKCPHC